MCECAKPQSIETYTALVCGVQETLMTTVITEYLHLKTRGSEVLRGLFEAADVDGDGNLTPDEFADLVHLVDASRSTA